MSGAALIWGAASAAGQEMLTRPFPGCWEVEEDSAVLGWGGGEMHAWKPKSELVQGHWPHSNAGPSTTGQLEGEAPRKCKAAATRPLRQSAFNA